ncbi:hypothetical protein HK098_000172 [Nowakowskiella sp. JEL0407]|nr:hypothetical protein HK098_000172 [Nowakowskiella sp. JEL0407]
MCAKEHTYIKIIYENREYGPFHSSAITFGRVCKLLRIVSSQHPTLTRFDNTNQHWIISDYNQTLSNGVYELTVSRDTKSPCEDCECICHDSHSVEINKKQRALSRDESYSQSYVSEYSSDSETNSTDVKTSESGSSTNATVKKPEEIEILPEINASIEAMISLIASIPSRYYKYNTIIRLSLESTIKKVDALCESINSKKITTVERISIGMQAIELLIGLWREIWFPYSPKGRVCKLSNTQSLDNAEELLNRVHMYRRIMERDVIRLRNYDEGVRGFYVEGNPREHVSHVSKICRQRNYTAPYLYLGALAELTSCPTPKDEYPRSDPIPIIDRNTPLRICKSTFLQLAIDRKIYKDDELEDLCCEMMKRELWRSPSMDDNMCNTIKASQWELIRRIREDFEHRK